jgi:hypothetical protein
MRETINSLEEFRTLINQVDCLVDDLVSSNLINIDFIRSANALLKQITEVRFARFNNAELEFASALFKTSIHAQPRKANQFFQQQLEAEVIQNATTLREIVRQAALKMVISSSIPSELRLQMDAKAYALKCSLEDIWERCQNHEYQEEQRSSIQNELP